MKKLLCLLVLMSMVFMGLPAAAQEPLFSEDFSDNDASWETFSDTTIISEVANDVYAMELTESYSSQWWVVAPGYPHWSLAPLFDDPFSLTVEIDGATCADSQCGVALILNVREMYADYFVFSLFRDGSWNVYSKTGVTLWDSGTWSNEIDLFDGQPHELSLQVRRRNVTYVVDGESQATTNAIPYIDGSIGFGLIRTSGATSAISAEFDNVNVEALPVEAAFPAQEVPAGAIFSEDFSSNEMSWDNSYEDTISVINDGVYYLQIPYFSEALWWVVAPNDASNDAIVPGENYLLEVDIEYATCSDLCGVALMFNVTEGYGDFQIFTLYNDDTWAVRGATDRLLDSGTWTGFDVFDGKQHRLGLRVTPGRVMFMIDGKNVARSEAIEAIEGTFGIGLTRYPGTFSNVSADFDNITVVLIER